MGASDLNLTNPGAQHQRNREAETVEDLPAMAEQAGDLANPSRSVDNRLLAPTRIEISEVPPGRTRMVPRHASPRHPPEPERHQREGVVRGEPHGYGFEVGGGAAWRSGGA